MACGTSVGSFLKKRAARYKFSGRKPSLPMNPVAWFDSQSRPAASFNTTRWSMVLMAGKVESAQRTEALEKLCGVYWPPLFAYVRRRGYSEEDAKDLTQEFFASLLRRADLDGVDPARGRFRTFLLPSLGHFLANQWDRARAVKRGGGQRTVSLEEMSDEQWRSVEPRDDLTPDRAFDARWAVVVMKQALTQLRLQMAGQGKADEFETLKPFLTAHPTGGDYVTAAARLGKSSETVAVMVHRLRQRYRECVRAEVSETVSNPLELEQEMRELREVLG
jgi:RNA polymerase sigma factor (sigma-70 family)